MSRSGLPDKQIWGHIKDGIFSVHGAYYLEVGRKIRERGENSEGARFDWKLILSMNVPGVVKVFLWKALNDCLPTRRNLFRRKMVESSCCPICESEVESITHILWSCTEAMDVWVEHKSPL